MKRAIAALLLGFAGCSTNPVADVWDRVHPARGVCSRSNASPVGAAGPGATPASAVPGEPGCEAALRENQNYRRGLLERFRRSGYPPNGVPPAAVTPVATP